MIQQTPKPTDNAFIVQVQPKDTAKHQLGDVIVGAFGLTGAMVLTAVVSGILLAALWILWRKARRTFDTDAPPSLGSVPLGPDRKTEANQRPDR
jgi:hypothetical protein